MRRVDYSLVGQTLCTYLEYHTCYLHSLLVLLEVGGRRSEADGRRSSVITMIWSSIFIISPEIVAFGDFYSCFRTFFD